MQVPHSSKFSVEKLWELHTPNFSEIKKIPISCNNEQKQIRPVSKKFNKDYKPMKPKFKIWTFRYPDDPYDRIWRPESNTEEAGNFTNATANITITNSSTAVPPIKVLQTALTNPERLEFLHDNLKAAHKYELYLYFLELNNSVQAGQRVFDIYIDDEKRQQIDILGGGSNYQAVVFNFTANGIFNLTMTKSSNNSQLGPICNAYEILQVEPLVQGTAQKDGKFT